MVWDSLVLLKFRQPLCVVQVRTTYREGSHALQLQCHDFFLFWKFPSLAAPVSSIYVSVDKTSGVCLPSSLDLLVSWGGDK